GVIEISTDDGATWVDVTTFGVTPGYSGTISDLAGNPLANRLAYGDRNPSHPARDTVTLDFGAQLAGETVRLRFRLGTDEAVGAAGWEIDDLAFAGLTNAPFTAMVDGAPTCQRPPTVNAGADQSVATAATVMLSGVASDPNADAITVHGWTQTAGPTVTLSDATTLTARFTAPETEGTLEFELSVSDAFASAADRVVVTVAASPDAGVPIEPPDTSSGGCGCSASGGDGGMGTALLALLGVLGFRRRRGPVRS
ncbi:MAG: peptidase, partial [Polyangiaceae bacterium]|nr:peptidase [Polyangiaceae bacterium]